MSLKRCGSEYVSTKFKRVSFLLSKTPNFLNENSSKEILFVILSSCWLLLWSIGIYLSVLYSLITKRNIDQILSNTS